MVELVSVIVAFVVFVFIGFSAYSSRNEKYIQRLKAYELKEAHMEKSMEKVRVEISMIENEILSTKSSFENLEDFSGEAG